MKQILALIPCLVLFLSFADKEMRRDNVIVNEDALEPFYNELRKVTEDSTILSVVHIGDSHIQADFFTGEVRRKMQDRFGNAGRGFVFPYNIAKTNGALDVHFSYDGQWEYCNILRNKRQCALGVSGFSVFAGQQSSVSLYLPPTLESSFNKVKVFNNSGNFQPILPSSQYTTFVDNNHSVFAFHQSQNSLVLASTPNPNQQTELQGLILENGSPGILYHALGINGGTTKQYLRSINFEKQVAELEAKLVIISFGSNDAYTTASSFCGDCIVDQYRELITRIRRENKNVSILITTPPDHYYQRRYANSNATKLTELLYDLAYEENLALWDLHNIMGGENSILDWKKENLVAKDLIHFNRSGYEKQASLFYDALLAEYNLF